MVGQSVGECSDWYGLLRVSECQSYVDRETNEFGSRSVFIKTFEILSEVIL